MTEEDKLKSLKSYLKLLSKGKFTGYVNISFHNGAMGRIEKYEEILKKEELKKVA